MDLPVKTIFLVDDNQDFLAVLKEYLSLALGIEMIDCFTSPHEALARLDTEQPDLMIVDISMPDITGLELTRMVHQRWPDLKVIILTLFDTPLHRQAALEAGASGFVTKSTMGDDLIPLILRLPLNNL